VGIKESSAVRRIERAMQYPWLVLACALGCYAIAAFVVIKMPSAAPLTLRLRTGLQVGLYLLASLLVARLVVLGAIGLLPPRAKPSWDLHLSPRRSIGGHAAWIVPVAAFGLLTAMREGEIEPASFDFWLSRETMTHNWTSNRTYSFTTASIERRPLAQLPVRCARNYNVSRDSIVRGFDRAIRCPATTPGDDHVTVSFSLNNRDEFCHFPLYRWATVPFDVHASISSYWTDRARGMGNGGGTVDVRGTIVISSFGFMSCRHFNEVIGERIGTIVVDRVNDALRSN